MGVTSGAGHLSSPLFLLSVCFLICTRSFLCSVLWNIFGLFVLFYFGYMQYLFFFDLRFHIVP
jgi:hypothetical protein